MKFIKDIICFFSKTKKLAADSKIKINKFICEHKNEIRMTMRILEVIFPAGTGIKKMRCVVSNVCSALGYDEKTDEVFKFVTKKCQDVYDEFKSVLD